MKNVGGVAPWLSLGRLGRKGVRLGDGAKQLLSEADIGR